MPMDRIQAAGIVVACVKNVGGKGKVSEDQQLQEAGIGTSDLVEILIDRISTNDEIGVPSVNFTIDPNAFHSIGTGTRISAVSDITADKSNPAAGEGM
jgi:hypothetical protein